MSSIDFPLFGFNLAPVSDLQMRLHGSYFDVHPELGFDAVCREVSEALDRARARYPGFDGWVVQMGAIAWTEPIDLESNTLDLVLEWLWVTDGALPGRSRNGCLWEHEPAFGGGAVTAAEFDFNDVGDSTVPRRGSPAGLGMGQRGPGSCTSMTTRRGRSKRSMQKWPCVPPEVS